MHLPAENEDLLLLQQISRDKQQQLWEAHKGNCKKLTSDRTVVPAKLNQLTPEQVKQIKKLQTTITTTLPIAKTPPVSSKINKNLLTSGNPTSVSITAPVIAILITPEIGNGSGSASGVISCPSIQVIENDSTTNASNFDENTQMDEDCFYDFEKVPTAVLTFPVETSTLTCPVETVTTASNADGTGDKEAVEKITEW